MATVVLNAGSWSNGFAAADLNSLASGGQKTSSLTAPQVDNSTTGATYAQVEVTLGALSPTQGGLVIVVFVPETQTAGTYVTGTDGTSAADQVPWRNYPHAIIALRQTAGAAQVQRSKHIELGDERYRLAVINRAGVALAASGNQVAWRLVSETVI